ncbi:NAD(P)H-binding protein [Lactiplantibacillus sp. WILCCON 0030]|uniref:NAD(P)H-binding protein n=1 Tax=Lactiplantibacillus brownii TaxID=3069269 RepID=A0ABU1AAW4_9LACO|nr:NAD(P)H-binding protein [Lactiplantibacillus brownii]MDQ7938123.1 NAD(P)H-binding protein [Lactiplantibacillus brownii]
MQNILVAGRLTLDQSQAILKAVQQLPAVRLTVYTTDVSVWPVAGNVIAGELTDTAGLTAAMLAQDLVLVQLDSSALVAQTQSITAAMATTQTMQLVVSMTDSVLSLAQTTVKWYQQRRQRQQLAAIRTVEHLLRRSQLNFTLIQGTTAADTTLYNQMLSQTWTTAVPARRSLAVTDYLTADLALPFSA